jgi:hypothetical protein
MWLKIYGTPIPHSVVTWDSYFLKNDKYAKKIKPVDTKTPKLAMFVQITGDMSHVVRRFS